MLALIYQPNEKCQNGTLKFVRLEYDSVRVCNLSTLLELVWNYMRSIHLTGCISFQSHLSHSLKSNKFIALVCFVTCDANRSTEDDMLSFPVLQNTHVLQGADNVTWMQCCFLAYI